MSIRIVNDGLIKAIVAHKSDGEEYSIHTVNLKNPEAPTEGFIRCVQIIKTLFRGAIVENLFPHGDNKISVRVIESPAEISTAFRHAGITPPPVRESYPLQMFNKVWRRQGPEHAQL